MSEQLAAKIKRLIATAIARGHVTFDELNEVMPAGEYTSEQIEDVTAMFANTASNSSSFLTNSDLVLSRSNRKRPASIVFTVSRQPSPRYAVEGSGLPAS